MDEEEEAFWNRRRNQHDKLTWEEGEWGESAAHAAQPQVGWPGLDRQGSVALVFVLAPFISFVDGWMGCIGWWFPVASRFEDIEIIECVSLFFRADPFHTFGDNVPVEIGID